jgi:hypothetical protein
LLDVVDVYLASFIGHSILEAMGAGKPVVVLVHFGLSLQFRGGTRQYSRLMRRADYIETRTG